MLSMGSSRFHPPSKAGHSPSLSPTFTRHPTDEAGCRDGCLFLWKGETEGSELSAQAGGRRNWRNWGTGYLLLPTKGAQALPSLKLTAGQLTNLKIGRPKPKPKKEAASSFQPSIFRCAVSFREGSLFGNDPPCICPCLFWGRRRDVHLDSVPRSKNIVV